MTNEEFMKRYDDYLSHAWVSSEDKAKAAEQKKREQEYNRKYYKDHREYLLAKRAKERQDSPRHKVLEARINQYMKEHGVDRETASKAMAGLQREADKKKQAAAWEKQRSWLPEAYGGIIPGKKAEGMTEDEIKREVLTKHFASQFEAADLDTRNQRMRQTYQNQGANVQASELAKRKMADDERQRQTLLRRSTADTEASKAQIASRDALNRKQRRKRIAAGQAQTQKSNAMQTRINQRNAKASQAQSAARRSQAAYQKSLEGRISRSVSRATKKVNDTINKAKSAYQKAKDVINNTSNKAKRIKRNVDTILKKYFG